MLIENWKNIPTAAILQKTNTDYTVVVFIWKTEV